MNRHQVPGRAEALREVVKQGVDNASPEMKHLAGMDRRHPPVKPEPVTETIRFTGGSDALTQAEREALPF